MTAHWIPFWSIHNDDLVGGEKSWDFITNFIPIFSNYLGTKDFLESFNNGMFLYKDVNCLTQKRGVSLD